MPRSWRSLQWTPDSLAGAAGGSDDELHGEPDHVDRLHDHEGGELPHDLVLVVHEVRHRVQGQDDRRDEDAAAKLSLNVLLQ